MNKYYFFVDYENVNVDGMNGIDKLTENCTVIIFYTDHAQTLTFGLHRRMNLSRAEIKFRKVQCGTKNALDFQLSSYIGYVIGQDENIVCYIVSKDNGFANVVNFWRARGANIQIVTDISVTPKHRSVKRSEVAELLEKTGNEFSEEDIIFVRDTMRKHMKDLTVPLPTVKNRINSELCKKYGGDRTKIIYNAVKPLIK